MKAILVLLVMVILFFVSQANAQSTLLLQEKCAEVVKKSLGVGGISTKNGDMTSVFYISHYNKKLDKCFALTTYTLTTNRQTQTMFHQELWNAIEEKQIGSYYSNSVKEGLSWKHYENGCKVVDTVCHSQAEFEALIKPYMEE